MWFCLGRIVYGVGVNEPEAYADYVRKALEEGFAVQPEIACVFVRPADDTDIDVYKRLMIKKN